MSFDPIETERLTLRRIERGDALDLAERRSDPETAEYQGWVVPFPVERAQKIVDEFLALAGPTPGSWYQLVVVLRETSQVVGDVGVHLSDNGRTATIGYTLHTWARGKGYATEAAAALCTYLINDVRVHRIGAETHPDNVASIGVLQRLGFASEGIRREAYWVNDIVSDDAMFGILARDWKWPRPT
jgi:RimJ/RimL family protein N-acetyltransferase